MMPRRYRGGSLEDRAQEVLESLPEEWCTPMQVGGSDASHHSGTLARLVRLGAAERKVRAGYLRPSYLYRINEVGKKMLKDLRERGEKK